MYKLKAERTPFRSRDLMVEFALMYKERFPKNRLSDEALALVCAKIDLETGNGHYCYNWNLGNIKAHDGYDGFVCYYECGESNLTPDQVKQALALSKPRTDDPSKPDCVVVGPGEIKLWGEHPWARFRAYGELAGGVRSYWQFLEAGRYRSTIPFLLSGNVYGWVAELKRKGYFTASFERYYQGVLRVFKERFPLAQEVNKTIDWDDQADALVRRDWETFQAELRGNTEVYLEQLDQRNQCINQCLDDLEIEELMEELPTTEFLNDLPSE